jgi:uncharacterized protein
MTDETLRTVLERFSEYLDSPGSQDVVFTWHGGEPLLAGKRFFRTVLQLQAHLFAGRSHRISNLIQSNLTLLDEEFAAVLSELTGNRGVGTSFDIDPQIRPLVGSRSYEELWFDAIEILRCRGMRFGLSYVVHRYSLGQEKKLYYYFKNLARGVSLRCNPLYQLGRGAEADARCYHITPQEYGEFLIRLTEVWNDDGRTMRLLPVSEWLQHIEVDGSKGPLTCDSAGNCHLTHIGVSPDGAVYNCGRAHDADALAYGNLLREGLDVILQRRANSHIASRQQILQSGECANCSYWDWCHGGCPIDACTGGGNLVGKTRWCESRRVFAKHRELSLQNKRARKSARTPPMPLPRTQHNPQGHGRGEQTVGPPTSAWGHSTTMNVPWSLYHEVKHRCFLGSPKQKFILRVSTVHELEELISAGLGCVGQAHSVWLEESRLMKHVDGVSIPILVPSDSPDHSLVDKLTEIRRLRESQFHFISDVSSSGFYVDALTFASLGRPVTLQFSDPQETDFHNLSEVLDYYLHSSTLSVPIQPLHSLLVALINDREVDLWKATHEDCRYDLYVTEDGRVTLSKRFALRGAFYGSIHDSPEVWQRSSLHRRMSEFKRTIQEHVSECSYCQHFPICGGYFQDAFAEYGKKECRDEARYFLSEVIEAVRLFLETSRRVDAGTI